MNKNSTIVVFGGSGLVGSAIVRKLIEKGYKNIIATIHNRKADLPESVKQIKLNLLNENEVKEFFEKIKPEYVFLAAAKVGGIVANNTYRADFIYENLQIQNNVIYNAYKYNIKKLMFLGSTCIYPKNCPQPIKEEYLLTGELEYTNEPYAIAKIAGIKMCESFNIQYGTNFISVMPTNLYGENDNFDLEKSHVLPALIRKIHLGKCLEEDNWDEIRKDLNKNPIGGFRDEDLGFSKVDGDTSKEDILKVLDYYGIKILKSKTSDLNSVSIEIWGSGKPMREFLYSDDMADACVYLMEKIDIDDIINVNEQVKKTQPSTLNPQSSAHNSHFLNIGTGKDISIKDLAYLIKDVIGYKGEFYFNTSKPDGTMKKVIDVSKLHSLGWKHKVELEEGIKKIYEWYRNS
ncbi:GDP-L-fucose synthase 1 [Nautilia profundicola AmH]|uniref:GDP-L-fucose synthase n=1 Tax=Nautilia profundicola (strain ATCC BAA-1463 / DSM 18972 / AmH) TaxID=598659 RepID=B9L6Q9_NAUPA|nr:GDP-L-fucose synthase [Nautilia profundicola]ACM92661.1 GDP-L-fucose synthase 1 [Nautilia profundicola AmH]